MKKKKFSKELVDLVVTDSYPVCSSLGQLLKKVDSDSNWQVIVCNKALEFIKKNDGFTDEYKPLQKINSKIFDSVAGQAKSIWLATLPDTRGDYLAYKFNEHVKKDLKLNCSVYRMRLPAITEDCVLNCILNKKNVVMDSYDILKYESRLVIDHAIGLYISKLISEKFPITIDFGLHTGILLNFIDKCNTLFKVSHKNFYSLIQAYDKEVLSKDTIKVRTIESEKIGKVKSLKDLYVSLSGFVSWYGFGTSLQTAYAQGCVTYPTSDNCRKTPESFPIKKIESSKKNWGLVGIKKNENDPDIVRYISSEALFSKSHPKSYRVLREYKQNGNILFNHKYSILNEGYEEKYNLKNAGIVKCSLGVDQTDILYYLNYLGFTCKQIPWIIYSLVKSGLIVYTTDTTVVLTTLGKLILMLLRNNVPIVLKDKYIINTLKGINKLSKDDEVTNYEFMQTRIDKVKVQTDSSYETIKVPKCSDKCTCGKRYSIVINKTGVFATCSNNECDKAGKIFPINIIDDTIEVQYDKLRKSKGVLKHRSKKSK